MDQDQNQNTEIITKNYNNFTIQITFNIQSGILKLKIKSRLTQEIFQGAYNNHNLPQLGKELFQNTYNTYLYILDNFKSQKLITATENGNLQILVITKIGRFEKIKTFILNTEMINVKDQESHQKRQFQSQFQIIKEQHEKDIKNLTNFYENQIQKNNKEWQIRCAQQFQNCKKLRHMNDSLEKQCRNLHAILHQKEQELNKKQQILNFLVDSGIVDKDMISNQSQLNNNTNSKKSIHSSKQISQLKSKGLINLKFNFKTGPSRKYLYDEKLKTIQRVKDPGSGYQIISQQPLPDTGICHFNLKVLQTKAGNIGIGIVTEKDKDEWDTNSLQSIFYIVWNGQIFKNGQVNQKCRPINKGDVIRVQLNKVQRKIIWFADNVKIGSVGLSQNFFNQKVYALIKMRDCDKIQIL